jgi:hypothetical protein
VEVPDAVPHRTVLTGDGPWTIRHPAGRLDLTVVDADGRPLGATLLFADHSEESNGSFALRGLPTGSLRLFVSAPGHKTAIVDTVVTEEPGEIRLVLPAR